MAAYSRGCKTIACSLRTARSQQEYYSCLNRPWSVFRRTYTAVSSPDSTDSSSSKPIETCHQEESLKSFQLPILSTKTHNIHAGVLLSRPPLLTPSLHPFEKAFFFYQKRLNERLAIPFTRYFYFKRDTPANTDWKIKTRQRGGVPAKELGTYNAYGKNAWNDEILVKEKDMVEPDYIVNQLVKDARVCVTEDGVVVQDEAARAEGVPMPRSRTTAADMKKDVQRLDRLLDRTLYLVVRTNGTKQWGFPSGPVIGSENLVQATERTLVQSCGLNMNTWIVGHVPIAYHIKSHKSTDLRSKDSDKNKVIFFMKGRIMAGQANLEENKFDLDKFRWLTKEEVSRVISQRLFKSVRDAMHER